MKNIFLVYTGEIEGVYKFRQIESLEENNGITWQGFPMCRFKSKLFKKGMSPGAIFPAEKNDDSYQFTATALPVARWKNQDDLVKVRAQVAANQKQKEVLSDLGVNDMKERLAPIREVYKNCAPNQKTMLLAEVMKELTR